VPDPEKQLCIMNIVLRGVLDGGVSSSLALDAHGKTMSGVLLEFDL